MRHPIYRILLLVVAALALGASGAKAAPFTTGLNRAYGAAIKYWGGEPTNCLSVDRQIVPNETLPEDADGWATIPTDELIPCVLYISRWLAKPLEWGVMCRIMVHEMGHLHGLIHNEIPGSVMNPETTKMPRICTRVVDRETRWAGTRRPSPQPKAYDL
jgi:hypothetical protein